MCCFIVQKPLSDQHQYDRSRFTNLCPCRIPLGYIFESNIVEILLQLFPQPAFRNSALQCLSEVALAAPPLMSMKVFQGPVGIAAVIPSTRLKRRGLVALS